MSAVSLQTKPYLSERLNPCVQHALWLLCIDAHAWLSTCKPWRRHGSAHARLSTHMEGSGQQTWKGLTCGQGCADPAARDQLLGSHTRCRG